MPEEIRPAFSLKTDLDENIGIWTATQDLDAESACEPVRRSLNALRQPWLWELHQFLANSGRSVLLYRFRRESNGSMLVSMGGLKGPFGEGMMVGTSISGEERLQLGASLLTAFAVAVSQGTSPTSLSVEDLGGRVRDLELPVR